MLPRRRNRFALEKPIVRFRSMTYHVGGGRQPDSTDQCSAEGSRRKCLAREQGAHSPTPEGRLARVRPSLADYLARD